VRLTGADASAGLPVTPELRERFLPEPAIIIESILSRSRASQGDRAEFGRRVADRSGRPARRLRSAEQFAFVNFEDAQQISASDIVTYGMVVVDPKAGVPAVAAAIAVQDSRLKVYTAEAFAKSIRKEIDESFIPVIAILVAIGFVVGTAVVGLTIYTATIERTRGSG
jgi:putative ABC transport system permease protein